MAATEFESSAHTAEFISLHIANGSTSVECDETMPTAPPPAHLHSRVDNSDLDLLAPIPLYDNWYLDALDASDSFIDGAIVLETGSSACNESSHPTFTESSSPPSHENHSPTDLETNSSPQDNDSSENNYTLFTDSDECIGQVISLPYRTYRRMRAYDTVRIRALAAASESPPEKDVDIRFCNNEVHDFCKDDPPQLTPRSLHCYGNPMKSCLRKPQEFLTTSFKIEACDYNHNASEVLKRLSKARRRAAFGKGMTFNDFESLVELALNYSARAVENVLRFYQILSQTSKEFLAALYRLQACAMRILTLFDSATETYVNELRPIKTEMVKSLCDCDTIQKSLAELVGTVNNAMEFQHLNAQQTLQMAKSALKIDAKLEDLYDLLFENNMAWSKERMATLGPTYVPYLKNITLLTKESCGDLLLSEFEQLSNDTEEVGSIAQMVIDEAQNAYLQIVAAILEYENDAIGD